MMWYSWGKRRKLSYKFYKNIPYKQRPKLQPSSIMLRGVNGNPLSNLGGVELELDMLGSTTQGGRTVVLPWGAYSPPKRRGSLSRVLKTQNIPLQFLYHHRNQGSILYHFCFKNRGLSRTAYPYSFTMRVPPWEHYIYAQACGNY